MINNFFDHEFYVLKYNGVMDDGTGIYGATATKLSEITSGTSVILTLPGAFTPTCTNYHVPSFEGAYDELKSLGVSEVYIMTCNDFYCQRVWVDAMNIKKLKTISDFELIFGDYFINTIHRNLLGNRNRREVFVFQDGRVKKRFSEKYMMPDDDPFIETTAEKVLEYFRARQTQATANEA